MIHVTFVLYYHNVMKIKCLVIGSRNPGKVNEWTELLGGVVKVVPVSDYGDLPEPKEDGKTFAENARQKAKHYAKLTKECVFAEDGGFEVEALGGAPGIRSRRILPGGKDGTDEELNDYILNKLKSLPRKKRKVSLTSAMVLSNPKGKIIFEDEARISGYVPEKVSPVLIPGYPYRSILFIPTSLPVSKL